MTAVRSVVASGSRFGEGPVWDVVEQALLWVNIAERTM